VVETETETNSNSKNTESSRRRSDEGRHKYASLVELLHYHYPLQQQKKCAVSTTTMTCQTDNGVSRVESVITTQCSTTHYTYSNVIMEVSTLPYQKKSAHNNTTRKQKTKGTTDSEKSIKQSREGESRVEVFSTLSLRRVVKMGTHTKVLYWIFGNTTHRYLFILSDNFLSLHIKRNLLLSHSFVDATEGKGDEWTNILPLPQHIWLYFRDSVYSLGEQF